MGRYELSDEFTGAALVRRAGEVLFERGGGPFQIASVSKQFAAAAVVALHERGELALDDRLERWFPQCPDEWAPITVHELLTNTSGIGHWGDYPEIDLYDAVPPDELVATFFARPLQSPPGTEWSYSSPGFVLLARIVEATAGVPYAEFLARELFAPLGLAETSVGGSRGTQGTSAGDPVPSFDLDVVAMGAGDVWSTTHDLARWNETSSLVAQATPHARVSPETEYGYGLFLGSLAGRRAVYHTGDNRGFRAMNVWLPDDETSVVVLVNDDTVEVPAIVRSLISRAST